MSEFDKEAEREKLRKQLEADEEGREVTQRMSELLLSGATMTGKHCDTCNNPIFRKNGQEFCPTCSQAAAQTQRAAEQPAEQVESDATTVDTAGETTPQVDQTSETTESLSSGAQSSQQPSQQTPQQPTNDPSSRPVPSAGSGAVAAPVDGSGDLEAARAALERKLARLASQAEATDDLSRARDLLAATREAAEALAALEGVERHTH